MINNLLHSAGMCILIASGTTCLNAQVATIDLSDSMQTIRGFGGAHYPEWVVELTPGQVDKAFGNLPGQIGLNILRMPVPLDTTIFPMEVPAAARASSNGAILMATPWTPPPWMKTNQNANGGSLDPAHYGDFADHLDSFANYMAANEAPLYAISIQNEPDILVTYASCLWTPEEMVSFLSGYGSEITSARIMAAESYNFDHSMTDPILDDAAAEAQVDIIAGHIYGGGIADYPQARDLGKEVWMTEHYVPGTTWSAALATGREIHDCMAANFNAYVYWYITRNESGFMNENGDISKRGYVMSHFAKFVRPGYTRVDVTTSSAPNVDVTAYKNDTNVVLMAINRNSELVDLDIVLQNGSDYIFTRFTTSESKNVINDGTDTTSGGLFTATLDALSITTFTTLPDNGGRYGNIPPVADAGTDETYTDSDNNGYEPVTLDGSASSDPDGTVTIYTWSEAGREIATGMQPLVDISTGIHTLRLTITDSDGATATDSVTITVNLAGGIEEVHVWLEAECGTVGSLWNILSSSAASDEKYVEVKPGNNSTSSASEDTTDQISYTFEVSEEGNYTLWGRARVPSPDDDSYWVKMDAGSWIMWNSISGGSTFQWDDVHNSNAGSQAMVYSLSPGSHTLTFAYREDGAELDKLYITNTGTVPTGLGDTAGNRCLEPDVDQIEIPDHDIRIYPNPFSGELILEHASPITRVSIFNLLGTEVLRDEKPENPVIKINTSTLDRGYYFIRIIDSRGNIQVFKTCKQ